MFTFDKSKFKERKFRLRDYLPWAMFCAPGVVMNKTGTIQKTYALRGPDLSSSTAESIAMLSFQLNNAIMRLGDGWAIFFEAQRFSTSHYDGALWDNPVAYIIDYDRMLQFRKKGKHYDTSYYLTFEKKLKADAENKVSSLFMKANKQKSRIQEESETFVQECADIANIIARYATVYELDNNETLSYLHTAVSLNWFNIKAPEVPCLIDILLADEKIEIGNTIKIGEYYCPIITINAFPTDTYPGMTDALNKLPIEYRWMTRFIAYDKESALKQINEYIKKYHGSQKSGMQFMSEAMTNEAATRLDHGSMALEQEANMASVDATQDMVGFGELTVTIMVWDKSYKVAMEKATRVKAAINQSMFTAQEETFNAYQVFMGMMPGNVYANIRRYITSTLNTAHILPLTSIWGGTPTATHLKSLNGVGTPHVICSTDFGTVFYLNLFVSGVGHTLICGPTGAGKSTLIQILCAQFLKYPKAKVISFDKDRSLRQLTMCVGGTYMEPGAMDRLTFQPLRELETMQDITWANEFVELLLEMQKIEVDASIRKAVADAIAQMVGLSKDRRTISSLYTYIHYEDQNKQQILKIALESYMVGGKYGALFDSDKDTFHATRWTMIEMNTLMELGNQACLPAFKYLFKKVDEVMTGDPTLLTIDEGWLMLQTPAFKKQIENWLRVLRKRNVAVVFASQNAADVANSDIAEIILQQCPTQIFLADPTALTPMMQDAYKRLGLTDGEIAVLAQAVKQKDYFYKSIIGKRLFSLILSPEVVSLMSKFIKPESQCILDEIEQNYTVEEWPYEIIKKCGLSEYVNTIPLTQDKYGMFSTLQDGEEML